MTKDISTKKQKFFDRWAPNYDLIFTTIFYQAIHKRLLEYVQLPEHPNILDLGCGTGKLLNRLASNFPDLKGTGLDFSAVMLRQARQQNQHRKRLIYVQGNAESLPFAQGQFDAVFNSISFLHYPNPQQVFSEISRVLKPGGYYYLVDYIGREKQGFLPISPNGIKFYSKEQRSQFGLNVGLESVGHYYLLGPILLSKFLKK
ncbi:MAG: class I SAM-dependent methyltransferase [Gomphosphaeria aponina SAG 52.96 = DSM 107014]|uniref:Class I SAM-dependent methyltransferase n=1 Tax=Gomphosphaeria aponina SAG 52.96 = DSM 107014 TaxID=1521640 RepID=A0A941GVU3_9CHRO|nr:class I SAM-dependent methyltransferase [Gomphosphaeria aponina SAG 52.96 = DSM 107014]